MWVHNTVGLNKLFAIYLKLWTETGSYENKMRQSVNTYNVQRYKGQKPLDGTVIRNTHCEIFMPLFYITASLVASDNKELRRFFYLLFLSTTYKLLHSSSNVCRFWLSTSTLAIHFIQKIKVMKKIKYNMIYYIK
jgi:hypothetical protein